MSAIHEGSPSTGEHNPTLGLPPTTPPSANPDAAEANWDYGRALQIACSPGESRPERERGIDVTPRTGPSTTALRKVGIDPVGWLLSGLVFAIAAACTFIFVYLHSLHRDVPAPVFVGQVYEPALGMHLEHQGDRVLLTWNRLHPLVKSAMSGTLAIDDGDHHRDVQLDAAQISNGSVLYRPSSEDVSFRLAIRGQND